MDDGVHLGVLDASRLQYSQSTIPKEVLGTAGIPWGTSFTDHMLLAEWTAVAGWTAPRIVPYGPLPLDPAACGLHYALQCFEGMKVYRGKDGRVRLFRPNLNIERFNKSAARLALPAMDKDALLELIWKLVAVDERFVPRTRGDTLYLRPTLIGTNPSLAVTSPQSALLYIIACPVGPYHRGGFKAISLQAMTHAIRSWPGGIGDCKAAANYGPTIVPQQTALSRGADQTLWLFGEDESITEAGVMNFFAVISHGAQEPMELVTPPLDGTILNGVTRRSVLHLAREKLVADGWLVSERKITMSELGVAEEEGRLREVFGSGTAAVICPVKTIFWRERHVQCGLKHGEEAGAVAQALKKWIEDRQYGDEEHEWGVTRLGL
ncbi:hypothetical protein MMC13_008007 [Lambiella insularis]|nr:hypothetical protein [Lambiella insularis]